MKLLNACGRPNVRLFPIGAEKMRPPPGVTVLSDLDLLTPVFFRFAQPFLAAAAWRFESPNHEFFFVLRRCFPCGGLNNANIYFLLRICFLRRLLLRRLAYFLKFFRTRYFFLRGFHRSNLDFENLFAVSASSRARSQSLHWSGYPISSNFCIAASTWRMIASLSLLAITRFRAARIAGYSWRIRSSLDGFRLRLRIGFLASPHPSTQRSSPRASPYASSLFLIPNASFNLRTSMIVEMSYATLKAESRRIDIED